MTATCRDLAERLHALLEGDIADDERQAILEHMRDCPCCGAYQRTYLSALRLSREALLEPPEDEAASLERCLAALPWRRRGAEA
jgi:anti-sigma factor RsiW